MPSHKTSLFFVLNTLNKKEVKIIQRYFTSNGTLVSGGQVGHLAHTSCTMLNLSAKKSTRFLLWTGRPLRQPILARGKQSMEWIA
jgi:hypothetical protein